MYAPNVLLAFHVSDWASLYDVGSYTGSDIDVPALGRRVAAFAKRSGMAKVRTDTSAYDVLFNDVADRDSAVAGNWWDRRNVTFPNFHRWERYVGAVHRFHGQARGGVADPRGEPVLPDGEQRRRAHPGQRAEYFFHHIVELKAVGIVALLFGRGNPGTTHTDDQRDGVTNPASFCTSDGVSGPQVCNAHVSHIADDDGGYLRIRARAYYQDPVTLERPDRGPRGASDR